MRTGVTISLVAHGVLIAAGLISLPAARLDLSAEPDMVPVQLINIAEITELAIGLDTVAPPPEPVTPEPEPEPPAAEPEPAPAPEVVAEAPPPEPAPAPLPEPEPEPAPEPIPEPEPEPAPDPVPAAIVPMPVPRPRPVEAAPEPEPAPPEPEPEPEPEPVPEEPVVAAAPAEDEIGALLNRNPDIPPQARPDDLAALIENRAANETPPPAGVEDGVDTAALTQTEIDALSSALYSALAECWRLPGVWDNNPAEFIVVIRFELNIDGTVRGIPLVLQAPTGPYAQIARETALRAVFECAPYQFLPPEHYDAWRENTVTFNPVNMFLP